VRYSQPVVGLPDLVLPLDGRIATAADPPSCAALTRQALQNLSQAIAAGLAKAEGNVTVNGAGVEDARYPAAAMLGRDHLAAAEEDMARLLAWLDAVGIPPGMFQHPSVPYNIYGYCRELLVSMHHARHWETISAVYNAERGTAAVAVACVHLISTAVGLAEQLSIDGTGCYLAAAGL